MRQILNIVAALILSGGWARAQEAAEESLAKAAQNPVADMISVPFQNNTNFQVGPYRATANVMNIQPVVPFHLTEDWNVITRTIVPVAGMPQLSPTIGSAIGLGDINPSVFLSPAKPSMIIWGAGPTMSIPSATERILGVGKWSAGPAVVALMTPGHWVIGALVNNVWSFAGDSSRMRVNRLTAQYFVNYNLPDGWYLTTSPIITANWVARNSQRWTVPFGAGFGRVFRIERQPINAQIAAYYNAVRPNEAPRWQLRAQVSFLFPAR